ncbi:PEP-CTERM sorting domain-containing protein [Gloeothece citriformis]|nr:PEP-CTERM sorting domain-containing protein [Gloeothece citriformis]
MSMVEPSDFSVVPEPLTILEIGTALLFGFIFKQKFGKNLK